MQAVRWRCHWSMAVSTMCCSTSFQTATSSWARLLFKHLSLKSLWIMRLTNVRGILSSNWRFVWLTDVSEACLPGSEQVPQRQQCYLQFEPTAADHFRLCVRSYQLLALSSFQRKSSSMRLFQFLLGNSFISRLEENPLHSHRFLIKSLSSKLNIIVQL